MDQVFGSQESDPSSRERASPEGEVHPYRVALEGILRLHQLVDPDRMRQQAIEVVRGVLGHGAGLLVLRQEDKETIRPFGRIEPDRGQDPQVRGMIAKAMDSATPVVDGQGDNRFVAVPLSRGSRIIGALYVGVGDLERRVGNAYLDLVSLVGRHLGLALDNAQYVNDISAVTAANSEEAIPAGLSLRESKRVFERKLVRTRLRESAGNIASAARSLDMDRGQLSRLLKKHGIDKLDYRSPKPR